MRLPCAAGTLSDAVKLSWLDPDQTVAQTIFLNASPAGFSDFSSAAWVVTDSGGNVSISGGILTLANGNTIYTGNGVRFSAGITRAAGFFEFNGTVSSIISGTALLIAVLNPSNALLNTYSIVYGSISFDSGRLYLATSAFEAAPYSAATNYRIRLYVGKSYNGTSWRMLKITVLGGAYTTETTLFLRDYQYTGDFPGIFYPCFQRHVNNVSYTATVTNPKWYSGYATDGPYIEYVHDAGAGLKFVNFDPTALSMPGSVASTNLKFAWAFDDDSHSYSAWLTLAQLNAVSKIVENHRYIRLRVQLNSDGPTYVMGAKPNSDTATDGAGSGSGGGSVIGSSIIKGLN